MQIQRLEKPLNTLHNTALNAQRIMKAGIAAIAHFTMKATIDMNGIWMSVIITFCLSSSSSIDTPPFVKPR